jgi:hypothetical protein
MARREYKGAAVQTTLVSGITTSSSSLSLTAYTGWPTGSFTMIIDPGLAGEEKLLCTSQVSGTVTITTRGYDNTVPSAHTAGAVCYPAPMAKDFDEANLHVNSDLSAHTATTSAQLASIMSDETGSGSLVFATSPNLVTPAIGSAGATFAGSTSGTTTLKATATASGTVTIPAVTGNVVTTGDSGTVTSAMIADATIVNADVSTSAAIAYSKLNLSNSIVTGDITNNTIVDADINASAAITATKIAGTAVTQADTGTVTSAMIANGTIVDADINSAAAITFTKLATPTADFAMGSHKITGVTDPTSNQDAATKAYADLMIPLAQRAAANGVATLDSSGLIPTSQLPPLAITDTFVVATQVAMLALDAQVGDVAVRTDQNKSYILKTAGASTLANWQELLTPTDSVLSVDGLTGAVDLSSTYATVANAANKLPLAGGTMSGAIAMGTNKITGAGNPTANQDVATKYYVDNVTTAPSNLTGPITSTGSATAIASQTGTGTKFVMDTSPTLITPVLGVATATSINGTTIPTSKTLVATDSATYVVPSQTSNANRLLTTDGTSTSWAVPNAAMANLMGYTSTATAATTTTLTNTSTYYQQFTGSTTQTVKLPVTSTLTTGWTFHIVNNSTGNLSVVSSGSNAVITVVPNTTAMVTCIGTAATTAADWESGITDFSTYTGTGNVVMATSPTLTTPVISSITNTGTITLPTTTTTLVGTDTTDTLTNKTLTSPVINTPKIASTYTAKTAAYTFASGDEGNMFSMNNAATQQFNIPTDATFNFAIGTEINVFWITGAGQPTIGAATPGTTTLISTGATSATPKLRVANSGATIKKLAANSWICFGDIA